ncbi:response regulator [Psychroflexus planctonicus]|uniref:DNA-binding response regulator n=1 Tax=Psychroflexus planctonicus TaxID=1526575 RepID=A0ABQ1SDM7_9FLAO|nr:response regulator transcription factor [Psychroflexus planctonicus]GGE29818.1 DNA-binding response regulator [Psychroflexus planctonicus]
MKNLLVADDHGIVRMGTINVIKSKFPSLNIFQAKSVKDAQKIVEANSLDFAIVDIKMPGGSSIDLVKTIKLKNTSTKILMFSGLNEDQYGQRFMKLGVNGFLSKHEAVEEVLNAIQVINSGKDYISEDLKKKINSKCNGTLDALSARELEIISLMSDGYGNLEISRELELKTSTVSTYKKRVMEKFSAENSVELIDKYRTLIEEQEIE